MKSMSWVRREEPWACAARPPIKITSTPVCAMTSMMPALLLSTRRCSRTPHLGGELLSVHQVSPALVGRSHQILAQQRTIDVAFVSLDHRIRLEAILAENGLVVEVVCRVCHVANIAR